MLIFSVVIFVFSTLTLSHSPPLSRKVGGHDPAAPIGAPPLGRGRERRGEGGQGMAGEEGWKEEGREGRERRRGEKGEGGEGE